MVHMIAAEHGLQLSVNGAKCYRSPAYLANIDMKLTERSELEWKDICYVINWATAVVLCDG